MTKVRATENEFRSQVISWLNTFLAQGGYPFELATGDPSLATVGGRRFPDVVTRKVSPATNSGLYNYAKT